MLILQMESSTANRIKETAIIALCVAFFFIAYCLIYFVTAAFMATSHGSIKWGEAWQALKDLFCG